MAAAAAAALAPAHQLSLDPAQHWTACVDQANGERQSTVVIVS